MFNDTPAQQIHRLLGDRLNDLGRDEIISLNIKKLSLKHSVKSCANMNITVYYSTI